MTDREKVMKGLECCIVGAMKCDECPYIAVEGETVLACQGKLTEDAVSSLKAQEPRVMTIDEVMESGDTLMWLEVKCLDTNILAPTSPYDDNASDSFSVSFQSGHVQTRGLYGKQWRCWTSKPTDEQRKATPWAE